MQRRLGAAVSGRGDRVIVLANGLGTSQRTWRHVTTALEPYARVVRFDNVCSPEAPPGGYRPEVYSSVFGYADDLLALLDELDVRDALVVGHSISGMIAMLAATAAPERVSRLAMICSTPRYLEDVDFRAGFPRTRIDALLAAAQDDFHDWAVDFSRMAVGADGTDEQRAEVADLFRGMRPDIALRSLQAMFFSDHRAVLARVTQPVWVLHSKHDAVVPASAGEYLVQQLPDARLVPLTSRGHVPHLTAPEEVIRPLLQVLEAWT